MDKIGDISLLLYTSHLRVCFN